MAERVDIWAGTKKGLFRAHGDRAGFSWSVEGPYLAGYEAYYALTDPADPQIVTAAVNHPVWGSHLLRTEDAGESWTELAGRPAFPERAGRTLGAIWHLAHADPSDPTRLYAGVAPAGLFASDDAGRSWQWLESLDSHPTRSAWHPARGGLALHSIQVDPRDPSRLYVAISAGGCYRSDDGGETWGPINEGVRADYLAESGPVAGHNPHALRLSLSDPDRLYRQDHCGVYRSDDRGESWREITGALPSEFGYALETDPRDRDRCWVIPEESSHLRCVCDGRLRVYETRDGGVSWRARADGLPGERVFVSVLRDGLCTDRLDPPGLYLGTSTGHLFAAGGEAPWCPVAGYLPPILCVSAAAL